MSKHKMVDGRLLQMNKSFGQLKQKQKVKITEWMYQAYRKQSEDNLTDEEALQLVFERIEEAKIWIPDYEIINRYRAKKNQFRKRLAGENVPQHIYRMESILDKAVQKMDALEKQIAEYEGFQSEIQKLEAYYTSPQWKTDFAADEAGQYPDKLKRGVLSEDGIWNVLERNQELLAKVGIHRSDSGEKDKKMRKILIVIDMQNDFIDAALGTKEAVAIVDAVKEKIRSYPVEDVIATMDTHGENYMETQEGKYLPVPHCIKGSDGWQIRPDIAELLTGAKIYEKPTFGSTALASDLKNLSEQEEIELELIGLCTDICVVSNALLLKASMPEVKISVDAACCAGVTPEKHLAALETMHSCQIQVING